MATNRKFYKGGIVWGYMEVEDYVIGAVLAGRYVIGAVLGVSLFVLAYNLTGHVPFNPVAPEQINIQKVDYNHDGIQDALITMNNGDKTIMYGIRGKDGEIKYYSASVMEKRNPDSVVDYSKIEKMVNEQNSK